MTDDPKRPGQEKPEKPVRERPSDDATWSEEEELDEALDETFPASDPLPPPTRPGKEK